MLQEWSAAARGQRRVTLAGEAAACLRARSRGLRATHRWVVPRVVLPGGGWADAPWPRAPGDGGVVAIGTASLSVGEPAWGHPCAECQRYGRLGFGEALLAQQLRRRQQRPRMQRGWTTQRLRQGSSGRLGQGEEERGASRGAPWTRHRSGCRGPLLFHDLSCTPRRPGQRRGLRRGCAQAKDRRRDLRLAMQRRAPRHGWPWRAATWPPRQTPFR